MYQLHFMYQIFLDQEVLLKVIHALIRSYLDFCSVFLPGAAQPPVSYYRSKMQHGNYGYTHYCAILLDAIQNNYCHLQRPSWHMTRIFDLIFFQPSNEIRQSLHIYMFLW